MDLEEKFIKETGLSSTIPNYINSDGYYSQEYVEWLEQKLTLQGVVASFPNTREFTLEVVKEITENHKELEPSYKECLRLGSLIGHKIINKLMNK